jgi:ABC-type uncharacterized transport system, ATPase component
VLRRPHVVADAAEDRGGSADADQGRLRGVAGAGDAPGRRGQDASAAPPTNVARQSFSSRSMRCSALFRKSGSSLSRKESTSSRSSAAVGGGCSRRTLRPASTRVRSTPPPDAQEVRTKIARRAGAEARRFMAVRLPRIRFDRRVPTCVRCRPVSRVLSLHDVVKHYGSVKAVDGVSFEVTAGRITGLLGRNGAGKTTTLRMITGVLRPDRGRVELFGAAVEGARDRLGYLPEERGLYRKMRVLDHLLFLAEIKGRPPASMRPAAERWLKRFELWEKKDSKVEELSKGNQQKVQLAGALLFDPELVVLDEPGSGLDPVNVVLVRRLLRELAARGAPSSSRRTRWARRRSSATRSSSSTPGRSSARARSPR